MWNSTCGMLRPGSRAASGSLDQEIRQQRHGSSGAAFLRAGMPGRAGDVEVSPAHALHVLAEEGSGRDGTTVAAGNVRHVAKIALELIAVVLGQRQLPAAMVGPSAGFDQL